MSKINVLLADNDPDALESICDFVCRERELQIIGKADDFESALKLAKEKGKTARIAFLDQSLINDNDSHDSSGRQVAEELKKVNPLIVIASLSSRNFPGADAERISFFDTKAFLQAVIGLAKK